MQQSLMEGRRLIAGSKGIVANLSSAPNLTNASDICCSIALDFISFLVPVMGLTIPGFISLSSLNFSFSTFF